MVALKGVAPKYADDTAVQRRLQREAQVHGRLMVDGVPPVYELVVEEDGTRWIALGWVVGRSLKEILSRADGGAAHGTARELWTHLARFQGLAPHQGLAAVLLLVERMARIVHDVHEAGVLHLDLKPGNVMIEPGGDPVILDFGAAIELEVAERKREELFIATYPYASRERLTNDALRVGRATDVYALGVILHELLTLRRPYEAESLSELVRLIVRTAPTPVRDHDPEVPVGVAAVCDKATSPLVETRYPTAAAFADDLARVRRGVAPKGAEIGWRHRARLAVRRGRRPV